MHWLFLMSTFTHVYALYAIETLPHCNRQYIFENNFKRWNRHKI
jgi:hypothetical protein